MISLTRLAKSGGPLTKRISLDAAGTVHSDGSACVMSEGTASRVSLPGIGELADLISDLGSHEALALGALQHGLPGQVRVVTKRNLEALNGEAAPEIIARTGAHISYTPGRPALALLDFDTKGMPREVAERLEEGGGFWAALVSVLPDLGTTARVLRQSTSAGLYRADTGDRLPGSNGVHVYLLVRDGADIERFLRVLHDRCWLAGYGWLMVGAGGQLLERSIVDRMVGAPERLVFEGAPVLEPPLAQDAESRRPIARDGDALDTVAACPRLSILETSRLRELRAREAHRLKPGAAKARETFIARQVQRLVERTGTPQAVAERVVARQCEGVLLPDVVLPFDDPDLADITVADVLADPPRYEGATLADPLEGVEYGTCKAKVMRRADGLPWIHSFAHGRTIYELRHDARAIEAAIDKAPRDQVADTFVSMALAGDLPHDETERLRNIAAERAGAGKRALAKKLNTAQREHAAARQREERERQASERRDPRPQIPAPAPDAPWLPQMQLLNDVLGASRDAEPPMRDLDGFAVQVRARSVPGLHTLSTAGSNEGDIQETRLPAPDDPLLTRLEEPQLAELIERHVEYVDAAGRAVHLGPGFVKHYIVRHDGALPMATAVATLPIVLPDGTLLSGRGLSRDRGIVFRVPAELEAILPNPDDCTGAAVAKAMKFLTDELFVDVATDYAGKCVLIAAALTILERLVLAERPAFFVTAGQRGGGKTTALHMICVAVLGRRAAACGWSSSEEERRKALFSYLGEGVPCVVWDNLPRGAAISCASIEKALTAETFSDRVLGETGTRTVPAHTVQAFTGNNITPRGDMASRSLVMRLAVDRPDPENREFAHPDPLAWTEANRGAILAALYTILLGNPRLREIAPAPAETRFKSWWHIVGSAIEHAAAQHVTLHEDEVRALAVDRDRPCPPGAISFRDLFLAGEADDEQTSSTALVLDVMRTRWPSGAKANEIASYAGAADEGALAFKTAIEAASGKAVKVITPTVISWRLKAIAEAPVEIDGRIFALQYQRDNEGGIFSVRGVR